MHSRLRYCFQIAILQQLKRDIEKEVLKKKDMRLSSFRGSRI